MPNADDARDREAARRALEQALASIPCRLPNPELDGVFTGSPITWETYEPIQTFREVIESDEDR